MSENSPTTPSEAPDEASPDRLATALALVVQEAADLLKTGLKTGPGPRVFNQVEALLKIGRALQKHTGTRVEDFLRPEAPNLMNIDIQEGHGLAYRQGDDSLIRGSREGQSDLQRERTLSALEMNEATRRREDARTRVTLLEEYTKIHALRSKLPVRTVIRLERRLDEILDQLAPETEDPCTPQNETTVAPTVG